MRHLTGLGRKSLTSGSSLYSESIDITCPCGRPLKNNLSLRILIKCFGVLDCINSHLCFSKMASWERWVGVISGLITTHTGPEIPVLKLVMAYPTIHGI